MIAFLALAWRAGDAWASERAAAFFRNRFACVSKAYGEWRLMAWSDLPVLQTELGPIFGEVYAEGSCEPLSADAFSELSGDQGSIAERFARKFWGPHVAFFGSQGGVTVYRDASGALPCILLEANGLVIVTSRIEEALPFLPQLPRINWDKIALFCAAPFSDGIELALDGVTHVPPGWSARLQRIGPELHRTWNPAKIARERPILDEWEASSALRSALDLSVRAALTGGKRVTLQLSGGIDSSILAACLARVSSPERVNCFNLLSAPDAGDERSFARVVCEKFGYGLEEVSLTHSDAFLERMLLPALTSYPVGTLGNWAQDLVIGHAERHGSQVLLSGHGGDAVLGNFVDPVVAADYFWRFGSTFSSFPRACMHVAQLSGLAAWQVGATAVMAYINRCIGREPRNKAYEPQSLFLKPDVVRLAKGQAEQASRWSYMEGLPCGKCLHLNATMALVGGSEYAVAARRMPENAPLLSQPVMEACFRIPLSLLTLDGWERGLARKTFASTLPGEIVMRRTKGDPTAGLNAILRQNRDWLRSRLCDGVLAERGLINKEDVATRLSPKFAALANEGRYESNLLVLLSAEHWGTQWKRRGAEHSPAYV